MVHPLQSVQWLNAPVGLVTRDGVTITTAPHTDLWQRTFYGFSMGNAPAAVITVDSNVTFTVRARFDYRRRYDQAGVLVWIDDQNWFKAAIEHETAQHGRLGSVLTTAGQSDWATRDVPATTQAWFRLSRRGPDFLLEARTDSRWEQLRVFHMSGLGPTDPHAAGLPASAVPAVPVRLGVYACSPEESRFTASFDEVSLVPSTWDPHT